MKKKLIILGLAAIFSMPLSAQKLSIAETTIDMGQILWKNASEATFDIKNTGSRKAHLRIVPDCDCTAVSFDRKELNGGQVTRLTVTYNAKTLGHFAHQIAVYVGDQKKPTWLTVKGDVRTDVKDYSKAYPVDLGNIRIDKNVIEFDDVNRSMLSAQELHIVNTSRQSYTPTVMHMPQYLTAVAVPEVLGPEQSGTIHFTLNPRKLSDDGLTQTTVYMARYPGDKVCDTTAVEVSAIVLPNVNNALRGHLEISSKQIDFVKTGKPQQSETITLTNTGKDAVNITSIQMFTSGLQVTLSRRVIAPGAKAKLKITGDVETLKKLRSRPRVLIITDDPQNQKIMITINIE